MKKLLIITILFILSALTLGVNAQVTQEWVTTYNGVGVGINSAKKCLTDKLGNIIVVGRSENLSFNDDFITLKYNSSGNLLWKKRYNGLGNGDDAIVSAVLDDSNNIYVTGYSQEGASLGGYNWVTIKYYPNGDTAWKRSFNWTANSTDEPFAMVIDKLRNIYLSGYGRANQPIDDDFITLKYDSNGELLWTNVYDSQVSGPDIAYSIAIDDSANVYPTGYSAFSGGNELITIKYNTNGIEQWIRKNSTFNGDYLRPAHVSTDKYNNIIANGYYYLGGQYAFITIKYNLLGDTLWKRVYKGAGNLNFCFALCTDDSANVYVAGRNTSAITGNDFVTIKYNQDGDTSWIRIYDGGDSLSDEVHSMVIDSLENVYVTGFSQSSSIGGLDYLTIKYDLNGGMIWNKKYIGNANRDDIAYSIILDDKNSVIVTGVSGLSFSNSGISTIKYSNMTGLLESDLKIEDLNYILSQNYPNPFNPFTKINYELTKSGKVRISVYDVLGKEIAELLNEFKNIGRYKITFSGVDYPSGVYFYSLFVDNNLIDKKRMLLIK